MDYVCPECGKTYYCNPDDPAAGSMCPECGQRLYDEAVPMPMSEEEIKRILDRVTGATP